jgi:hypothetical protein
MYCLEYKEFFVQIVKIQKVQLNVASWKAGFELGMEHTLAEDARILTWETELENQKAPNAENNHRITYFCDAAKATEEVVPAVNF